MLESKELKKLIVGEIILFGITLLLGFFFYRFIDLKYKREFVKNNGYMISALLNKHPELEDEVITSILSGGGNFEEGKAILEKYGLDETGTLNYLEHFHNLQTEIIASTLLLILVIFILLSFSYWYFLYQQNKKLNSISEYMNEVLHGKYNLDIKNYEEGNISTLKNDIYKLTVKLKEGRDQSLQDKKELEQVLSDISHQIRTPLTSMYVINDLFSKEDIDALTKQQFLEKNRIQLERIEWLVTTLLKMSRLDSGSVQLNLEPTNIVTVIEKALEPLQIPIELKKIQIQFKNKKKIMVRLDSHWTVEVFVNVLKNAYEHTSEEGFIHIAITDNPLYTEVAIHDTGTGIKKEELPHIFERFYTGSGNKESIGVGLNMAKKVMEKQHGEIYATSIEGEGTTFFIKFYKDMI